MLGASISTTRLHIIIILFNVNIFIINDDDNNNTFICCLNTFQFENMAAAANFMLVVFIDDSGEKESIDIVPAKWIFFDEVANHLVTPFISSSSKANVCILNDLVQSDGEPLPSWTLYRISVRGSASK